MNFLDYLRIDHEQNNNELKNFNYIMDCFLIKLFKIDKKIHFDEICNKISQANLIPQEMVGNDKIVERINSLLEKCMIEKIQENVYQYIS